MDYGIKGKVALVGGGSQGIGRACAAALAAEGARVAICARRPDLAAEAALALESESGSEVIAVIGDLSVSADVEKVLAETRSKLGDIDILITNTGGPRPGKFFDLKIADWDAAYDLLLKSALLLIHGVLPGMQARKWGRIIGITSVSVKEPIENLLLSNVFRVGVTALYKSLARDVAKDGITLNTVLPGLTDTERLRDLYGNQAKAQGVTLEEVINKMSRTLPLQRLTRAEELGATVAFLASDAASAITGAAVPVDGGQLRGLM
jgi:3-oxoacyl-[acyl-carrier protein] reductase